MITPHEAVEQIVKSLKAVSTEKIPLFNALGRVMAEVAYSKRNLPPGNSSTMDGYAVKKSDIDANILSLKVNGIIAAGDDVTSLQTPSGTCWRIMTGAILPEDTDFIIAHENTNNSLETLVINEIPSRTSVRQKGEESAIGDKIDFVGQRLNFTHITELASRGVHFITVYRKPKIIVFSSGNEVVDESRQDEPSKIFDTNSLAIKAILESVGCDVQYGGVADDNPEKIKERLKSYQNYDLIISSGGVSAGDFDYFSRIPDELGIKWEIQHVKQRPAQPVFFGKVHNTPIFSLPGTPVGAVLCCLLYAKPAAKVLAGYKEPKNNTLKVVLEESADKRVEATQFNMARLEFGGEYIKAYPKTLANYSQKTLASSNAFLILDNGKKGIIEKGSTIDAIIINPFALF